MKKELLALSLALASVSVCASLPRKSLDLSGLSLSEAGAIVKIMTVVAEQKLELHPAVSPMRDDIHVSAGYWGNMARCVSELHKGLSDLGKQAHNLVIEMAASGEFVSKSCAIHDVLAYFPDLRRAYARKVDSSCTTETMLAFIATCAIEIKAMQGALLAVEHIDVSYEVAKRLVLLWDTTRRTPGSEERFHDFAGLALTELGIVLPNDIALSSEQVEGLREFWLRLDPAASPEELFRTVISHAQFELGFAMRPGKVRRLARNMLAFVMRDIADERTERLVEFWAEQDFTVDLDTRFSGLTEFAWTEYKLDIKGEIAYKLARIDFAMTNPEMYDRSARLAKLERVIRDSSTANDRQIKNLMDFWGRRCCYAANVGLSTKVDRLIDYARTKFGVDIEPDAIFEIECGFAAHPGLELIREYLLRQDEMTEAFDRSVNGPDGVYE
ncbi:MAG: hypothetical protein LBI30_00430 [Holosporales bacterium]|nr:hypothetical protein [Holosporales bacterium]